MSTEEERCWNLNIPIWTRQEKNEQLDWLDFTECVKKEIIALIPAEEERTLMSLHFYERLNDRTWFFELSLLLFKNPKMQSGNKNTTQTYLWKLNKNIRSCNYMRQLNKKSVPLHWFCQSELKTCEDEENYMPKFRCSHQNWTQCIYASLKHI